MFSRHTHEKPGTPLPSLWAEEVRTVLYQTYQNECAEQKGVFHIRGWIYENELLLIICFSRKNSSRSTSCFLSCDLEAKDQPKKLLYTMLDLAGTFYDDFFSDKDWDEYYITWDKTNFKNKDLYYKISREDITLTLEANQLLDEMDS